MTRYSREDEGTEELYYWISLYNWGAGGGGGGAFNVYIYPTWFFEGASKERRGRASLNAFIVTTEVFLPLQPWKGVKGDYNIIYKTRYEYITNKKEANNSSNHLAFD